MSSTGNVKNNELIASRWAKALVELVGEDEKVSKEEVLDNLRTISDTFKSSDELSEVINNPSISTDEKQAVLSKLFEGKILPIVFNYIFALNLKKRINIIEQIAVEYEKELNRINNITHIDITSAIELTDEKKNSIKSRIAEKLNRDVIVNWDVNKDIIAGLVFNIDDTVVDNSIRNKLNDLQKVMTKG